MDCFNPRARPKPCSTLHGRANRGRPSVSILEHDRSRARHHADRERDPHSDVSILEHDRSRARRTQAPRKAHQLASFNPRARPKPCSTRTTCPATPASRFQSSSTTEAVLDVLHQRHGRHPALVSILEHDRSRARRVVLSRSFLGQGLFQSSSTTEAVLDVERIRAGYASNWFQSSSTTEAVLDLSRCNRVSSTSSFQSSSTTEAVLDKGRVSRAGRYKMFQSSSTTEAVLDFRLAGLSSARTAFQSSSTTEAVLDVAHVKASGEDHVSILEHDRSRARRLGWRDGWRGLGVSILEHDRSRARRGVDHSHTSYMFQSSSTTEAVLDTCSRARTC